MNLTAPDRYSKLLEQFPCFLTANDLVAIGIFPSKLAVYKAKGRGTAPPSVELSEKRLRFPKDGLLCWLEARTVTAAHSE